MEQKVYVLENLCCANCAAKIEAKINALPQIQEATIVFATKQLRITAADPDELLPELVKIAQSIEPDVEILPHQKHHHHHDHDHCDCGHSHEHHHEHHHKGHELLWILVGAGLFVLGLILERFTIFWHVPVFVISYLLLGWEVLVNAVKNLRQGHMLDENFLMGIATIGAFFIGEFPEAVGIMLFYRIGEHFEEKAVQHSRKQIMEAVDLRPEVVHLENGTVLPAKQAAIGDILVIRPGDRIPLDGTVLAGESRIDTSPITGEPVPVTAKPGSSLVSGCVNTTGTLTMRVDRPLSESMVTRILNSVENAAANKPVFERFITRFARVYTPIVVGLATFVALVPSLFTGEWDYWVYTALSFLVMSCPCALVLSVPLAFFSGIGVGSRKGILFKGGASLEALAGIKAVVMDKTGTLTQGNFVLQQVIGDDSVLPLCAACEQYSTHPIAQSILSAAAGIPLPRTESTEEIAGQGIRAIIDGNEILCGNEALMRQHQVAGHMPEISYGTRVFVAKNREILGYLDISDTIKTDAENAISRLNAKGIATAMLTGDHTASAQAIAGQLGIKQVWARLLPDEKLEKLQQLRAEQGSTMFVGDGINDAPVLAGADVGAAMGSGADAAIEAADVVFLTSQASAIPDAIEIAVQTRRIALQNVVFALAVKLIVMLLGLTGHASMWAAVFADSGVAMLCVLNSVRMLYRRRAQ